MLVVKTTPIDQFVTGWATLGPQWQIAPTVGAIVSLRLFTLSHWRRRVFDSDGPISNHRDRRDRLRLKHDGRFFLWQNITSDFRLTENRLTYC